jgi:hypothetical protein
MTIELGASKREWVYFGLHHEAKLLKIGFSCQPETRCKNLELRLLATHEGGLKEERGVHARFQQHRVRGEFFTIVPELKEYVCALSPQADWSPFPPPHAQPPVGIPTDRDLPESYNLEYFHRAYYHALHKGHSSDKFGIPPKGRIASDQVWAEEFDRLVKARQLRRSLNVKFLVT